MVETIESFVAKLQSEGVEAGQRAAEGIRADADKQVTEIIADAEKQAQKIISDARTEGQSILARTRTDVELAARDTILNLRDTLGRLLTAVLREAAGERLSDSEFLGKLLHDLVVQYAQAEIGNRSEFDVNVSPDVQKKLTDWAIHEIIDRSTETGNVNINMKATLSGAGFEYNVTGATVEVTLESVVSVLGEMVGPKLRELLDRAMAQGEG